MIVEDVRIVNKDTTIGDQHDESFITYYDVQVKVFDFWWSLDKNPEKKMKLQDAIDMRDQFLDIIKGRS
jgi:hypothetical protein